MAKKSALSLAYGLPFLSTVISWFGGPSTSEEAAKDLGSKGGFFSKIKDWIVSHYPVANLLQVWKGIKQVFSGQFSEGLFSMAAGIPFLGSIAEFLGGGGKSEGKEKTPGDKGGMMKQATGNILRRILKWVPKTVLGFGVRSRVAGLLAGITGISKDVLLGTGDIGGDAPDQQTTEPNLVAAGDSLGKATKGLAKAGASVSDNTKKMEKEAQGFMKSSPGAWTILAKAGNEISKRVKQVAVGAFGLISKVGKGLAWIGMFGIKKILSTIKSAMLSPIKVISKQFARITSLVSSAIWKAGRTAGSTLYSALVRIGSIISSSLLSPVKTFKTIISRVTSLISTFSRVLLAPINAIRRKIPTIVRATSKLVGSVLLLLSLSTGVVFRAVKSILTGKTAKNSRYCY